MLSSRPLISPMPLISLTSIRPRAPRDPLYCISNMLQWKLLRQRVTAPQHDLGRLLPTNSVLLLHPHLIQSIGQQQQVFLHEQTTNIHNNNHKPHIDKRKRNLPIQTPTPGPCSWSSIMTPCNNCLLYTSPSPRDGLLSRMPSSA